MGAGDTLVKKIFALAKRDAGYSRRRFYCDCWLGVRPVIHGGGQLLLAGGEETGAQRSDWLAALRPGYDLCGDRRIHALHGLDQLRSSGPELGCGGELACECLPPFRWSSCGSRGKTQELGAGIRRRGGGP